MADEAKAASLAHKRWILEFMKQQPDLKCSYNAFVEEGEDKEDDIGVGSQTLIHHYVAGALYRKTLAEIIGPMFSIDTQILVAKMNHYADIGFKQTVEEVSAPRRATAFVCATRIFRRDGRACADSGNLPRLRASSAKTNAARGARPIT